MAGEYRCDDQIEPGRPLARAVVVMPRDELAAVKTLPIFQDVVIVSAAELDALRDDKARFDWLLHKCVLAENAETNSRVHWGLSGHGRAVIDAAMKGTP